MKKKGELYGLSRELRMGAHRAGHQQVAQEMLSHITVTLEQREFLRLE